MNGDHKTANKLITSASLLALLLGACSSPQAQQKERAEAMSKFVSGAVQHMLDRNPETIQQSMTVLTRDELTEPLVEKLQQQKLLPETDISILKIVDEAKMHHSSNKVQVESVSPLDPATKPEIRFRVTGKDTSEVNGKDAADRPFEFLVTCQLTKEMDGFPRITDLSAAGSTAKSIEKATGADGSSTGRKHHHHR